MTLKEQRLRTTINRLSLLAAFIVTISLPSVYLFTGYRYLQGSLETEAEITADTIDILVTENPDYWRYQSVRLEEMLRRRDSLKPAGRKITDLAGNEIAKGVLQPARPTVTARAGIKDAGSTVAQVELAQSLNPLLWRTLLLTGLGLGLGGMVFAILKLIPMRALNEAQHELQENERKYHALFSNLAQAVLIVDFVGQPTVVDANEASGRLIGLPWRQVIGMTIAELFDTAADGVVLTLTQALAAKGSVSHEFHWRRLNKLVHLSVIATAEKQVAVLCEDVTDRRKDEQRVQQMAYYDPLTGLPNRSLLYDRIQQAMARANRTATKLAFLFIDLDRFKPINDTLGHEAGDRLLEQIATRLKSGTRAADTVARFSGDEFVMVVGDLQEAHHAVLVAEGVLERLTQPYQIAGQQLSCGCSIGIAIYPDEGVDADTLINHADLAMYAAKEQGGNRQISYAYLLNNPSASPRNYPR